MIFDKTNGLINHCDMVKDQGRDLAGESKNYIPKIRFKTSSAGTPKLAEM